MISSARAILAAAPVVFAAACGQGVHDLNASIDPLIVLHGHVAPSALTRPHPDAPLVGALIWAAVPAVNPVCVEFADDARIEPACPDPSGVFLNDKADAVSPVDADGNFDLPLFTLPMVSVSVGDASTRIAYGILVVVEDVDGDGQPSLVPQPSGNDFESSDPEPTDPDRIVAATFYSLNASQQRIVFREGGFVNPSNFYPGVPLGCEPPGGFSIMTAPASADPPVCDFASVDPRLELAPLSVSDGLALMCRGVQKGATVGQPRDRRPQGDLVCVAPGIVAAVNAGICPWLRSYALKGCELDPKCPSPEWDHTMFPPDWWPPACLL